MKIDKGIPKKVVARARKIAGRIEAGEPMGNFRAHRLQCERSRFSVPVGRRYRLLVEQRDGSMVAVQLRSHEAYNRTKPR